MNETLYNLPAVFIIGLVFGLGPCTITCLPFLDPVFLAKQGGLKHSWKIILPFSLGRLASYSSLGVFSGWLGASMQNLINTQWVAWLLGGMTVAVGGLIFYRSYKKQSCASHRRFLQDHPLLPSGLFFMGVGMAATPCLPLSTVLLTAASTSSAWMGLSLGLSFGVGAVIIPALAFGIGMAYFGQRIRTILYRWRTTLERASALLLCVIGFNTLWLG